MIWAVQPTGWWDSHHHRIMLIFQERKKDCRICCPPKWSNKLQNRIHLPCEMGMRATMTPAQQLMLDMALGKRTFVVGVCDVWQYSPNGIRWFYTICHSFAQNCDCRNNFRKVMTYLSIAFMTSKDRRQWIEHKKIRHDPSRFTLCAKWQASNILLKQHIAQATYCSSCILGSYF